MRLFPVFYGLSTLLLITLPTTLNAQAFPGWDLVWSDEFETPGQPDPAKWGFEGGMLRNNEAQLYTGRPENVRVEGGHLVIEARKESMAVPGKDKSADYTAASAQTKGKAEWLYGRVEVRAKIPTGRGMWPAIWMMPLDMSAGWPACGEIDIMENVGFDPEVIHWSIHTKAYNHVIQTQKTQTLKVAKPWEDFHVYAIEWDSKAIHFYMDGIKQFTYENDGTGEDAWPFNKPFYLRINTAVGGNWGGSQGIDDSIFPTQFLIDYVRVYQKKD